MKIVMKGNRQLTVADEAAERYLNQGYCEVDEKGQLLRKGKDKSPDALRKELKQMEKDKAKVDAENQDLKAKLTEAGLTW